MSCVYLIVFLLGLLPLSTLTTAEQSGGAAAALDDRALTDRFCLRGYRSKIQNPPPPQSTEKSLEKTSFADAAMQETAVEPEKMSEDDEEGNPPKEKVAMKNSKERRYEGKASDNNVKITEQKAEEATKSKPAAVAAASPFKPKRSNFYDFEDIN
ncbi:hypothetical protein C2S52_006463 [Perilla frutescens var. hirtella]|uniref:Uncharacterized protein n=1 Tax=Perilla frutescens var. hirtella TaxID=608512 RepID=A0AAD4JIS3_PERFH|nr:hypothetical protein C2S52_006463 [Perilla frutescens var. hirtella]KAH6834557.1 hypothetical protein C2S53_002516 [Perilla frutescens var. hirtella]